MHGGGIGAIHRRIDCFEKQNHFRTPAFGRPGAPLPRHPAGARHARLAAEGGAEGGAAGDDRLLRPPAQGESRQ